MARQTVIRRPSVLRAALLYFAILLSPAAALADCYWDVCVDSDDYVIRLGDNSVRGQVNSSLEGPYQYYYQPGIYAWLYLGETPIAESGAEFWGDYGGSVSFQFYPTALPASGTGPWTYTAWGYHMAYSDILEVFFPPYTDLWDGYDSGSHEVQRPTISGFLEGRGMWNLGVGSSDPQPTWGGIY